MTNRAKRLRRLASAQDAIARAAVMEQRALEAEHASSAESADKILGALSPDSPLHGLLTPVIAGALTRNAAQTHRLAAEAEAAASQQRLERVRADALANRAAAAERLSERRETRRALEDIASRKAPRRGF